MVEGLGAGPLRIEQNYLKLYACCRINHSALEAVGDARAQEEFSAEAIDSVRVSTERDLSDGPLAGMVGPYPDNMLSAKFNIPYAVAALLVRGSADLDAFIPETIEDPRIRDLASRVTIDADSSLGAGSDEAANGPIARAAIRLRDGRELTGGTTVIFGDYGNRAPRQDLIDKFKLITDGVLPEEQLEAIIDAAQRLDEMDDVRQLTRLAMPGHSVAPQADVCQ